jgi:hypothetical protein
MMAERGSDDSGVSPSDDGPPADDPTDPASE